MEYFLIFKWKDCIEKLTLDYQSCGVEWRGSMGGHYSGNFWWMKSELIRKLPEESFTIHSGGRFCLESLPGKIEHNHYDFFNTDMDLQHQIIPTKNYIK